MQNPQLYNALRICTFFAYNYYTTPRMRLPGIPYKPHFPLQENLVEYQYYTLRDCIDLVAGCRSELKDKWIDAQSIIEKDEVINSHLNIPITSPFHNGTYNAASCLDHWVAHYLFYHQTNSWNEEIFKEFYIETEKSFYEEDIECRTTAIMQYMQITQNNINIDDELSIIQISYKDKAMISIETGDRVNWQFGNGAIVYRHRMNKQRNNGGIHFQYIDKPMDILDRLYSALKVYKGGYIGSLLMVLEPRNWILKSSVFGLSMDNNGSGDVTRSYTFLDNEISPFRDFWVSFCKIRFNGKSRVERAIKRLVMSSNRMKHDDRIIDYLIGFESLLLNGKDELSYRLSLYTASLLGETPEKRKRIFVQMKKSYDQRSRIVHGDGAQQSIVIDGDQIQIGEFSDMIEEYLRQVIQIFLQKNIIDPKEWDLFIDYIDKSIIQSASISLEGFGS